MCVFDLYRSSHSDEKVILQFYDIADNIISIPWSVSVGYMGKDTVFLESSTVFGNNPCSPSNSQSSVGIIALTLTYSKDYLI